MRPKNEHYYEGYLKDCARRLTPQSVRTSRSTLRIFSAFLEDRSVHVLDVDKDVMRDYLDHLEQERKSTTSTKNCHFSTIAGLYNYLMYEDVVDRNPVPPVRKRYLNSFKKGENGDAQHYRQLSNEEVSRIILSTLDPRARAVLTLLAKTGIRRGELEAIDLDDIDWERQSIEIKPHRKRTNLTVFFDDECARALKRWLAVRDTVRSDTDALFANERVGRLGRNGIECIVNNAGERVGLHDPTSRRKKDRVSPHCFRHWFTTALMRAGMPREHVKELRGDKRGETIDIYYHIDHEDLRKSYLSHMPRLGI